MAIVARLGGAKEVRRRLARAGNCFAIHLQPEIRRLAACVVRSCKKGARISDPVPFEIPSPGIE